MNILVSGASIAGPALAYWLRQAIDVRGAALDVLRAMGLLKATRARRTEVKGVSAVDASGIEIYRSEERTFTGGRFGAATSRSFATISRGCSVRPRRSIAFTATRSRASSRRPMASMSRSHGRLGAASTSSSARTGPDRSCVRSRSATPTASSSRSGSGSPSSRCRTSSTSATGRSSTRARPPASSSTPAVRRAEPGARAAGQATTRR